jgi:hypothetical protein
LIADLRRGFFKMTIARKLFSAGAVAAMAAALAGCMSGGPGQGPATAAATGVEGKWVDGKGTGVSTLAGGVFQTVATDTGQKLADGSYKMTGANSVLISGTSLIRQAPISFNCLLASANQLNCTSAGGANFVLNRQIAAG